MRRALFICIGVLALALALPSMGLSATLLSGTVLENSSGNPVSASILAYRQNDLGDWDLAGAEQTDKDGKFSFGYLGAGTFYLECDAYIDCNPQQFSCSDKYLPQFYNNIPVYQFADKTIVILEEGATKELETIKVKARPFYFDTASNSCTEAGTGGLVKITSNVVNTTGRSAGMWFFGVMDSPKSKVNSNYYGLSGSYPFGGWQWKVLKPGVNTITMTHQIVTKSLKGRYEYWVVGGDSSRMPMTPYLEGWICYGLSAAESDSDLSAVSSKDKGSKGYGQMRAIPLKVSVDGKVLETGPMPR